MSFFGIAAIRTWHLLPSIGNFGRNALGRWTELTCFLLTYFRSTVLLCSLAPKYSVKAQNMFSRVSIAMSVGGQRVVDALRPQTPEFRHVAKDSADQVQDIR